MGELVVDGSGVGARRDDERIFQTVGSRCHAPVRRPRHLDVRRPHGGALKQRVLGALRSVGLRQNLPERAVAHRGDGGGFPIGVALVDEGGRAEARSV